MSVVIERSIPLRIPMQSGNSEKVKGQIGAGESTIHMLKPSGLTGISNLDYVELRNYIYGVNGRY